MPESRFEGNQDGMDKLSALVKAKLQPQMDTLGQSIIIRVNAEMAGQPVADILDVLRTRMHKAGIEPLDEGLRPVAEAISSRNLK
jgi:hypothetical protein